MAPRQGIAALPREVVVQAIKCLHMVLSPCPADAVPLRAGIVHCAREERTCPYSCSGHQARGWWVPELAENPHTHTPAQDPQASGPQALPVPRANPRGGMEPRPTHLAAWPSGIEASAVTEGWVHTLAPVEAGEQVCMGDTEGTSPLSRDWQNPVIQHFPRARAPDPALPELHRTQIPPQVAPTFLSS